MRTFVQPIKMLDCELLFGASIQSDDRVVDCCFCSCSFVKVSKLDWIVVRILSLLQNYCCLMRLVVLVFELDPAVFMAFVGGSRACFWQGQRGGQCLFLVH